MGVCLAAAIGLPVGVALGLAGTALLAPKDFPRYDAGEGPAAPLLATGRSGAAPTLPPVADESPALAAARVRLLAIHSDFLRRERYASAVLDRYRPTATRPGRRPTPALTGVLERTARAHARARREVTALVLPPSLEPARAATISMLEEAEAAHAALLEAGRRRDPDFALAREAHFGRALASHYGALGALRAVPRRDVSANLVRGQVLSLLIGVRSSALDFAK